MYLENISKRKNRKMKAKRIGRGYGSGVGGHTVGRGQKGQKSRTGHKSTVGFEGGNVPFFRRMPKYKGFRNKNKVEAQIVSVGDIQDNFKTKDVVTFESLKDKGLVRARPEYIKILSDGEIKIAVTIEGIKVSAPAREKIEKAGGIIK
jgi:large subunit ribosomal protein L15